MWYISISKRKRKAKNIYTNQIYQKLKCLLSTATTTKKKLICNIMKMHTRNRELSNEYQNITLLLK